MCDHDGDQNARMDLNENLGCDNLNSLDIGAILKNKKRYVWNGLLYFKPITSYEMQKETAQFRYFYTRIIKNVYQSKYFIELIMNEVIR